MSAFFNLFEFCGLLLAERFFPPTVVFKPLEPQSPVMSGRNGDTISIELPSVNPFAEPQPQSTYRMNFIRKKVAGLNSIICE
ncbi:hypothetical protein OPQ81_002482 [Rhizoctonia solani]|nr:hypothetical protein OPQ81_002482 [Rhizoctonia solani]